jgi:hypothetical protein
MKTGPFGTGVFVLAGLIYGIAPFQQSFDVQDAPDSPPSISLVSSSSVATAFDAIADWPIDVRPQYSVRIIKL